MKLGRNLFGRLERLHELLVGRRRVRGRVVVRVDDAERDVAHVVELVVVGDVAGRDQLDARLVEAALAELLHERRALPRRQEHEHRVGLQVGDLLQERREVGAAQRRADLAGDLAAVQLELALEELLGIEPGAVVGDERDDLLDLVLRRPFGDRDRDLRQREAGPHDVRRLLGDDRGRRRGHDHRRLALRRDRRGRERERRQAEAGEHVDLLVDDELLRDPPRRVGDAGVVLDDDLDLAAGDGVAVLRDVELDRGLDLLAGRRRLAGHRQDEADLERRGRLRLRAGAAERRRRGRRRCGGSGGGRSWRSPVVRVGR